MSLVKSRRSMRLAAFFFIASHSITVAIVYHVVMGRPWTAVGSVIPLIVMSYLTLTFARRGGLYIPRGLMGGGEDDGDEYDGREFN